jgi:Uri superfamily endonuclease
MRIDSGLYQLVIQLSSAKTIRVGKLGSFLFPEGYYVYTGSAKRGLSARVARHIRKRKRIHWHVDYLLKHGNVISVNRFETGRLSECQLNQRAQNLIGSTIVALGFGSSDCKCKTHLFFFRRFRKRMENRALKLNRDP